MGGECRAGAGGDCLIKLFGTTIPVPDAVDNAKDVEQSGISSSTESEGQETSARQESSDRSPQPEVVDADEDPKSSPEPKEKLKKPDKVLPCPRCSSMDTKFCYFNNYNVNQPRHFCKNCQRYWTAGGAMRNVPVGAGRRKNKSAAAAAASHFLHRVRAALPADPLKGAGAGGTVLSFGVAPAPASHLNKDDLLFTIHGAGHPPVGPCSETSSNSHGGIADKAAAEKPADGPASINGATIWPPYGGCAPPPAYYSSGIAIPIYPAAPGYWSFMVPGPWGLPWPVPSPTQSLPSPTSAPSVSSGCDSLPLGKHLREGDDDDDGRGHGSGGKVWAPKTVRIDDADEVARSSIWSLIGIEGDSKDADAGGVHRLGTVFETKRDAKTAAKQAMITTSSPLLHANPVALTRSVAFQEGS